MKTGMLTGIFLMLFITCGDNKPRTYTIDVIDGVTRIHNLEPMLSAEDPGIQLEFVQRYGAVETSDPDLLLDHPRDAAVDRAGNVFITDQDNHQLKKFDSSGNLLLTIGQRGQGPEDFMYPRTLHITDDNLIMVTEPNRTKIFTAEGRFIRILEINGSTHCTPISPYRFTRRSDRMAIRSIEDYNDLIKKLGQMPMVTVVDTLGNTLCSFGEKRVYNDMVYVLNFNSFSLQVNQDDEYYMAFGSQNRIEKHGPEGRLIWTASRTLPYEESEEIKKVKTSNTIGNAAIASMFNRFSTAIEIDGSGRLWIPTQKRQFTQHERLKEFNTLEDPEFIMLEVYDQDGILLQRIPWEYGTGRQLVHIHEDRMFFTSWVDMCVYEYRIVDSE